MDQIWLTIRINKWITRLVHNNLHLKISKKNCFQIKIKNIN